MEGKGWRTSNGTYGSHYTTPNSVVQTYDPNTRMPQSYAATRKPWEEDYLSSSSLRQSRWDQPTSQYLSESTVRDNAAYGDPTYVKRATGDPGGLRNLGNTCYMNSVVQALLHTPSLVDRLVESHDLDKADKSNAGRSVGEDLTRLFYSIKDSYEDGSVYLRGIKRVVGSVAPKFIGSEQQDAQEFLKALLEIVEAETVSSKGRAPQTNNGSKSRVTKTEDYKKWYESVQRGNKGSICNIFAGSVINTIKCQTCFKEVFRFEEFDDLILPLNESGRARALDDLLSGYFAPNMIRGYDCEFCGRRSDCELLTRVAETPQVLIITLKRFISTREKNYCPIVVSPRLDLLRYKETEFALKPEEYNLFAVVNHVGTLWGGHYTADCFDFDEGVWYRYDDDRVSRLDFNSQDYIRSGSERPYILFYARKNL